SGEVELNCPPAWEASNFASHGHDPWPSFDAADVPIRILKAETGSTCRSDGHEAALTASGRIRLEVIPGTTHFLPMERPDLVRSTLLDLVG
ncbi:MAG: alpha/beta hydrolase, partial [Phenylobacterium sp.]|nr:alpha/beta hydrolase [Phenylobacterium sp.]